MLEFIKMFGMGILYTILFPFIIVVFSLYVVYVFGNYLVLETINFFGFFFGYTFTTETELEKKLMTIKNGNLETKTDDVSVGDEFDDFFAQNNDILEDLKGRDDDE